MMLTRNSARALPAAAALLLALAPLDTPCSAQQASGVDTQFANFAFASELGSGIYTLGGRTIQVYQIPMTFNLRPAKLGEDPPGLNLLVPLTVGFFDFQREEGLHVQIPGHLGAASLEPGVQLDYWLAPDWHLLPYIKGGATYSSDVNALIYGFGLRSDYTFEELGGAGLWRAELAHAGVHYVGTGLPNDSFTRLRNGAQLRRGSGLYLGKVEWEIAPYGLIDVYFDAPTGPASGISGRTIQVEFGVMFGVRPMWKVLGIELPRLGVGYRVAGELSGWRLVIGDPF